MLKGILKHRRVNSNDDIEEATASSWNDLLFDDVETVFHNRMSRLAWVIKNDGEYTLGKVRNNVLMSHECGNQRDFHPRTRSKEPRFLCPSG
jgi:hypothetical protein